jgi:hypothetical protein
MMQQVVLPTVAAVRVNCVHADTATIGNATWTYEFPVDDMFPNDDRFIYISIVRLPVRFLEASSNELNVPVQGTVSGNTCWYRLVAHALGDRECEECRNRVPQLYFQLLSAIYAYGLFFKGIDAQDELPHVFAILSPQGKAMDLDFLQFESMLTAECYQINGGAVFERLARAIHKPGTDPFPLRLRDSYPDHGIANLNSYQNVGLTASDMEAIEKQTCYVLKWTPSGFAVECSRSLSSRSLVICHVRGCYDICCGRKQVRI